MTATLSRTTTTRILFYYHVGGVLVFLGPALWYWRQPTDFELLLLVGIGLGTTACMFCYFRAFAVGEANAVAPAEYTGLVYAALLGYFIFAEQPSKCSSEQCERGWNCSAMEIL